MIVTQNRLQITPNRRFLQYADGTPFFYLGDTAWELFHRLTLAEADRYLTNRAAKGFTVIQAVALAELEGLTTPNANGDIPFHDQDPTRPNEAYFRHVDAIVARANELGLFIGLLPTWGAYWRQSGWNANPIFTPESAYSYGQFLGERYRDSGLIWILGGDRNVTNDEELAIITSLAAGLTAGDGGSHLKTFHPIGPGRSAELFPDAAWLDFHMCQSSHGAHDHDNGLFIEADYALTPIKPTLDGEPRYETIPVGFYFQNYNRYDRFDAYDVRQAAYWALLAGACGHTYGKTISGRCGMWGASRFSLPTFPGMKRWIIRGRSRWGCCAGSSSRVISRSCALRQNCSSMRRATVGPRYALLAPRMVPLPSSIRRAAKPSPWIGGRSKPRASRRSGLIRAMAVNTISTRLITVQSKPIRHPPVGAATIGS
jgi:hypothetical protein